MKIPLSGREADRAFRQKGLTVLNKKVPLGATLALIIIAMALTVSVTMVVAMRYFNSNVSALAQKQNMYDSIADVDTAVRQQYTLDEEKLREALARGYISSVGDPYAAFLTADEYKKAQDVLAGNSTGFGIDMTLSAEGQAVITRIHRDSAADKAGMQVGDVMTALDGTAVTAENFASLQSKLDTATKVMVTVSRAGASKAYELTASPYALVSVEEKVIGSVGYIRILAFHENTVDQFKSAYSALEEEGVSSYVFDVRNNDGGSLDAATAVIAYLMPRGRYAAMVSHAGEVTEFISEGTHSLSLPATVLVNSRTAGEAELFAGALQQFELATVVGETTAGKARVQQYFPLKTDNAALKLSVGELQWLTGESFQDKGIVPGLEVSLEKGQDAYLDLLTQEQDTQLQQALILLGGNTQTTPSTSTTTGTQTTTGSQTTTGGTTTSDRS